MLRVIPPSTTTFAPVMYAASSEKTNAITAGRSDRICAKMRHVQLRYPDVWAAHLPPGADPAALDLTAKRSLPAAWAARWTEAPEREQIVGVLTRGDLDRESRRMAGRLHGAGLRAGDRILFSAG